MYFIPSLGLRHWDKKIVDVYEKNMFSLAHTHNTSDTSRVGPPHVHTHTKQFSNTPVGCHLTQLNSILTLFASSKHQIFIVKDSVP